MPAFALVPASPSDLEAVARVQFAACATDHGFPMIFPAGATLSSITHFVRSYEDDMDNDPTCHIMLVKEALSGEVASFAVWHFYPPRSRDDIDREMLMENFPLPNDANKELGNRLIHNSTRKRHEVVAAAIRSQRPYACEFRSSHTMTANPLPDTDHPVDLAAVGTNPKYQRQGAASLLLRWGLERADDHGLATYVEGTSAARRLYEKHGFKEVAKLQLELSPWKEGDYFNTCMVREPTE